MRFISLSGLFLRLNMARELKTLPYFPIKANSADGTRIRKGICAVFGNVDSVGDRILNGAFQKTITEGSKRVKHLWQHDFSTPPIASIVELKEVGRDELPPEVLAWSPEATGGLMVAREYYEGNELADWVLQGIDKGDITEMSFGYDVIGSAESTEGEDGLKIRNLTELKLYDTSDVNWGANAATVAVGAKSAMPLGVIAQQLNIFAEDVKAGRRNAAADMELIKGIHGALVTLGYKDCMPMDEQEPKKAEPEPSQPDTSLDLLKAKARTLALRAPLSTNQIGV